MSAEGCRNVDQNIVRQFDFSRDNNMIFKIVAGFTQREEYYFALAFVGGW